ncbi:S-layer protein [Bacillus toyonensis]|uniref:immunoglobulin-like domain-containing protein n=1 Tax=Bacillus toyonensis TaxID=155322 RepID=UPI000BF7CFA7|nr:S-layer protein [Bacillus toyonensis]
MKKDTRPRHQGIAIKTLIAMNVLASPFMGGITEITKVAAETQVSAARVLYVEGKGDPEKIRAIDRRQFKFSPYEPTGLYASPNEKIIIQVEGTQNIQAYIGTFSYDGAWNQDSLVKSFTLKPGENTIESPNGGMIYFYNPQQGGTVKTEIKTGGTTTPLFELGKHTQQDLVDMLDKYPDTHAVELKGERVLITASPARVKKYLIDSNTDPVQLLKKLDESISIQDRVSGLSEKESDKHYVHFVEDNHSTGYMYSYYGRTAYIGDAIQHVLNVKDFTENGWGPWHEAGHQRQQLPWTWDGLGEVTVNIYSMSVQRAFGNKSRLESGTYDKAFTYLNKPQSEKDYNKIDDVFVKLVMFWQLDLAFGEEFYPKLHQLYRAIPNEELPKSSDEKIQDFIYNTSKVTQKNLLPFFDKWGLIATPETRQKIENLNYPLLAAPIWEAIDSKPVIVEENEQTPDMEPNLTVPVGATINVGDSFAPMVGVAATDKEDGDLTHKVTVDGKVDTTKLGTYVLTYTVKDSKGHKVTAKQTVMVKEKEETKDETPVLKVPSETTITEGDKFNPMKDVSATDKEDGDITSKITYSGDQGIDKEGTYKIQYVIEDSKGHRVIKLRTVIVKAAEKPSENQAPMLKVPFTATLHVGDTFDPMAGLSATDKEDGDLTDKVTVDGKVDTTKPGTYVLTYTVKDSSGHLATQTQTVTVKEKEKTVEDQEPELTVPEEAIITAGDKFDPMSRIKAIDKEDGAITDKVIHFGEVDTSKTGTYKVKFLVRDSGGNEVTTIQKVVVKDKDNGNGNNGSGNNNDSDNNNTNNGNGNSNISNNSTSDKKEDTYKELPKTGTSTNNSAAMGILMVFAGMVLTFGRKFRKVLK